MKFIKNFIFTNLILGGVFLIGSVSVFAADKIKTLDFLALFSASQISTATTTDFSIYIGDNLSGVTDPVKSYYVEISGVYTDGSGSLSVSLNNDPNSTVVYTFPSVSHPTKFTVLYKDPAGLINPISAGSYTYTLSLEPTDISISGLSAVANLTIRYNPDICDDGQPASEKIKTTKFYTLSSNTQINTPTSSQFSLYLGDDLSGIADPVKSIIFEISGIYTQGGSLGVSLDSNSDSLQTYTLPTVSYPTPFNIIYSDDSGAINPSSAGVYRYNFDLNPTGVTISGLSVIANLTHRYKPPSCGTGYPPYGDLVSAIIDVPSLSINPAYNSVYWKGTLGGDLENQGKVKFRFAASNNSDGPWNDSDFIGGSDCNSTSWFETSGPNQPVEIKCFSGLNNKRYLRYKVRICSDDCQISGQTTPTVDDVVISWSP